ncbi:MAG: hypothetical protein ACI86M_002263 [Saprospiraceae bacterium]|jgi:hypothetical protein
MKRIFTLITLTYLFTASICAQIDQISVGPSYSQQAYYSLSTGETEIVANDAWDISFSAIGQQDAGVFFNESTSFMSAPMQVFVTDITDWSEDIVSTETYVDSVALYNPENNWTEGAFNTVKDPTSQLDYGWGAYNPQTNTVEGTKVFVIKKRDGSFFKMQVESLSGGTYTMNYADLDGSNEITYEINKADAENGMIHFSFATDDIVEMPTDYDLIFQRYTTPLDAGDGSFIEYTVTGVLLANGTEAVLVDGVDPTSVIESDYDDQYTSLPTTIGHSWKYFDFSIGWVIDEDRTQFVKTADNDIYQLTFYDFEGSSTGITTLERTFITSVSTKEQTISDIRLAVFPNPTTDYFHVESEEDFTINITISNMSGQVIKRLESRTNTKTSVIELPLGIYNVSIQSPESITIKRLVVR